MTDWLASFSEQYYVSLIDYDRAAAGLLIGLDRGTMMAVMDAAPRSYRWCVDVDSVKDKSRFVRWACWADKLVGHVAVVGCFSLTDPTLLREAVGSMQTKPLAYTPGVDLGARHCQSLAEFLAAAPR